MITGIIVALPDEISSLTNKKVNKGDCIFINDKTLLTCSGAGPENATNASLLLIKKGAKRLISWGCAAALEAELKPGDLVLPKNLHSEKHETISIESLWLTHVLDHFSDFKPLTGLLAESPIIVAESSEKQTIHSRSGAIALDMESVAIAKTAIQHDFPALVIRSIADPVTMSLPNAISYALNQQGDVSLTKLLWFLLTHPNELPALIKLGLHFKVAKNKLKSVSKQLDIIVGFEQKTVIK